MTTTHTEAEEVAALDKALTALGFTDDSKLERVLHVLMPRVVDQMASVHASTKKKVMEILSHVNKRLKAQPGMKLPLADLTTLYVNLERPPMVRNFALVYVEQAFDRADPEDRAAQITRLLHGVAARTAQHKEMIMRMAVTGLAVHEKHVSQAVNEMAFMLDAADRAAFLHHCLEYLMYQPNTAGHAPTARPGPTPQQRALQGIANVAGVVTPPTGQPLTTGQPQQQQQQQPTSPNAAAATAAAAGGAGAGGGGGDVAGALGAPTAAAAAPPGLSPSSVTRILGPSGTVPATRDLATKKLALLEFFNRASDATVPPVELILHYLVAACDADHEVSRRGEDLLKRRCTWETNRPSVNLEDPALVARLYRLFLGGGDAVPEASRALPASHAVKMRLVSLLCRSVAAANAFPSTVQCIFTCLYGAGTTVRLKAAGMELAVWVLRHATDAQLKQASPLLLRGMLQLLDGKTAEGGAGGDGAAAAVGDEDSPAAAASTGASNFTAGTVSLRGFCYQALGQLAVRQPSLVTGTPDIAARVFSALSSEPEGCRASVQDAARSLAQAYGDCGGGVAMAIEGLLLASVEETAAATGSGGGGGGGGGGGVASSGGEPSRRLVAAQWARKLFPFDHVPARYLCIVAAGDTKPDVREEGKAGLRPPEDDEDVVKKRRGAFAVAGSGAGTKNGDDDAEKKKKTTTKGEAADADAEMETERSLPPAEPMLRYLATRHPALTKPASLNAQLPLPPLAMAAALKFIKRCITADRAAAGNTPESASPELYRLFLDHCLVKAAPSELTAAAATALLELAEAAPATVLDPAAAAAALPRLRHFAAHVDGPTRRVAAKLCGVLAPALQASSVTMLDELLALAGKGGSKAGSSGGGGDDNSRGGAFDSVHGRFEDQDGALCAAGYVTAAGISGGGGGGGGLQLQLPDGKVTAALSIFVSVAGCKNPTLAGTAAEAIGHVGLCGPLPLPRAEKREADAGNDDNTGAAGDTGGGKVTTIDDAVANLLKVMKLSDASAAQRAARAAGYVVAGGCEWVDAEALLGGLFALSKSKSEEVQLAVGEALSFAFGNVGVSSAEILSGSFTTLSVASKMLLTDLDEAAPAAAPDAMDVDGSDSAATTAAPAPAAATDLTDLVDGATRAKIHEAILSAIFDKYLFSSRPEERCAASVWLLALVLHTRRHPKLLSMLPEIQEAFGSLLGDQNELTQEMASRGVSVVYELGTEEQRKELLADLMGTLSGEGKKKRKVKLSDDSQVFQEGTMKVDDKELAKKQKEEEKDGGGGGSSGGGGSLNTYKELCSIVNDIGQPDLIYKFMDLANYQAMLNSSKGAAYGFASIAKRAGDALAPHLAKLLPKLYRMQHDPNPRMQEAVKGIWQAVVDDPKSAVETNFGAIMEELLAECGGRQWRARQSSASALAELLSGRRFAEVEPYLERVWTVSLRVIDDIKETVREAGKTLCRTVRGLTVRLCDAHHSSPAETSQTISIVLPLLLQTGLLSPVKEIQALSLDVLMKVAKQAGSAELRPHIPEMVKCLLEALSSMEDARLNYIEQHAPAIGLSTEKLEHARLHAAKASPMGETLDVLMGHVDEEVMKELVPVIASVLRSGVGLNTRAGAGRFVSRLCLRRGSLVRPHAGKLFKSLLAAANADRSSAVASAMVSAVAAVARFASEPRVNQLVDDLVAMYDNSDDDNAEKGRSLAAHLALELSRGASDALRSHAAAVLPTAFVGRFDDVPQVKKRWEEVWEENSSGASSTLRLYLDEVWGKCAHRLASAQYQQKKQGAAAAAAATKAAPEIVKGKVPDILEALLKELPGRVWEGKEAVPEAVADVVEACPEQAATMSGGGGGRIIAALVVEAGRKKAEYRKASLEALDRALAALAPATKPTAAAATHEDFFAATMPLLREVLTPKSGEGNGSGGDAAMAAASGGGIGGNTVREMEEEAHRKEQEAKVGGAVADQCLRCLATLCAGAPASALAAAAAECADFAAAALSPVNTWTRRSAGLRVVAALARRTANTATSTSMSASTAATWLDPLIPSVVACADDPKVSQLRMVAVDALSAAAAVGGEGGEKVTAACVSKLQGMREDDRAPDVRGAAGRALGEITDGPATMDI